MLDPLVLRSLKDAKPVLTVAARGYLALRDYLVARSSVMEVSIGELALPSVSGDGDG